jgi:hypothetical protein
MWSVDVDVDVDVGVDVDVDVDVDVVADADAVVDVDVDGDVECGCGCAIVRTCEICCQSKLRSIVTGSGRRNFIRRDKATVHQMFLVESHQ